MQAKALAWVNQEVDGAGVGISYLHQTEERLKD
jgi:hypothetical protein